jgi:hypothetical protein
MNIGQQDDPEALPLINVIDQILDLHSAGIFLGAGTLCLSPFKSGGRLLAFIVV